MIENTLYGIILESPRHRLLHVSPALQQAKYELIKMGLLDAKGYPTIEGVIAQRIIKESSPRRAAYRCQDHLWHWLYSYCKADNKLAMDAAKAAVENLSTAGLIEIDTGYSHGEAYKWRA